MPANAYFRHDCPNGLCLLAESLPSVRSASFQFLIPCGAATDPEDALGGATLLEALCYRGAGERNTRELSDALDLLGVQRSGGASLLTTAFGGSMLADDLLAALEVYADIILRPRLPEEEFPAEQELALAHLERLEDAPAQKCLEALQRAYFPGPFGRSSHGTEAGLRGLTAAGLRAEHQRRYRPQGAILAVAGRFDWEALRDRVVGLFSDWKGASPDWPPPVTEGREAYLHIEQETAQEQISLRYPTVGPEDPDTYKARMAVAVLSGGMAARLFTEVREKRGLCYSVSASYQAFRGAGAIQAYAGTTPERCQETLDVLVGELRRLSEGISNEEVERARVGILSGLIMQGEASRSRAQFLAREQLLLGRVRTTDEIRAAYEAVTPQDILGHLEHQPVQDFTVVTLGPKSLKVPS